MVNDLLGTLTPIAGVGDEIGIGAVIVTHAKLDLAVRCLRSLDGIPRSNRVVVVNTGYQPDRPEWATLMEFANVLTNARPMGYGANANLGVAALSPVVQHVLLLNDDVVFMPGAIARLLSEMRSHLNVAAAGPRIVYPDGRPQASQFAFPSIWSELAQLVMLPQGLSRSWRARYVRSVQIEDQNEVDWVLGAAMLVNRLAFDAVGGFDERYQLYSEETDLCRRMRTLGWLTRVVGDAEVIHSGAASTGSRHAAELSLSRGLYISTHWPRVQRLALRVILLPVLLWNAVYVCARVLLKPSSAREKAMLFFGHWRTRPRVTRGESRP
jgi:GT2 family glycosyltransferase